MQRSIPVVATVGLALILSGCSSEGTTSTPSGSAAPTTSAPALSGELTMWVDEERIKDIEGVAAAFTEKYGVKVSLTQKANGDIKTDFISQGPTGKGPDVVIGANDWVGELVASGIVAPVQLGDAADGLSDGGLSAFSYDGQVYGVPYAVENIALIRNNAIVKETPETFQELVDQNATTGAKYPILIQQGADGDAYHLYPLMSSFGISLFGTNADGTYTTDVGLGGEGGQAWADFLAAQGAAKVLSADIDGQIAKEAFVNGESPYIVTGPWNVVGADDRFAEMGMDISVLPVPSAGGDVSRPFAGFQGFYVNAKSENPIAANAFVTYLASDEAQTMLFEDGGRVPVSIAAAAKVDNEYLKGFGEAGVNAVPQPVNPKMDAIWGPWGKTQVQLISGAADPATAWDGLIVTIEDLFK